MTVDGGVHAVSDRTMCEIRPHPGSNSQRLQIRKRGSIKAWYKAIRKITYLTTIGTLSSSMSLVEKRKTQ